jgi:hypothetical protein
MYEDNKTNQSALELRLKQITRYVSLGLLGVLALCALLFLYVGSVKQNEQAAISNTQVQADQTKDSDTCKIYPEQELCVLARKIAADPTQTVVPKDGIDGEKGDAGATGAQGERGRGVTSFVTNGEGNLIVTFTDGQTQNAGKVVGKNGIDGINGTNGTNGRGVLSASLDQGNLIIRYSDGTQENIGMVVGPAGQSGTNGTDGVNGKDGAQGAPGVSVVDLKVDPQGYVQVYYSDGQIKPAGRIIVSPISSISCNVDTFTIAMIDGTSFSTTVDCTPDSSPIPPANGTKTTTP